jgi:hypothetical protein
MTKYTKDMAQGDWGEYYFAYKVIKTFGWPCRILDIDIGIDAQIEILDKEFNTTGRFIGVQVKTTKKLSIKDKHIAYWRSCEFPVIIVHVDPKSKEMLYWTITSVVPPNCIRTASHYHLILSPNNIDCDH